MVDVVTAMRRQTRPADLAASSASDLVVTCQEHVWGGGAITPAVYFSHDGGATATRHDAPAFGPVASPNGSTAVVIGGPGLERTTDEGATWNVVFTNAAQHGPANPEVGFTTSIQGFVIFRDGTMLMTTTLGRPGRKWHSHEYERAEHPSCGRLSWASSRSRVARAPRSLRRALQRRRSRTQPRRQRRAAVSTRAHTTTRTTTTTTPTSPPVTAAPTSGSAAVVSASFVSPTHGWALAGDGHIDQTTDGGRTWSSTGRLRSPQSTIRFIDASDGFRVHT